MINYLEYLLHTFINAFKEMPPRLRYALPIVAILLVAMLMRVGYLYGIGFNGDIESFGEWLQLIRQHGIFSFYEVVPHRPYPPLALAALSTALLGPNVHVPSSPFLISLIKLPSVLAELGMIIAAYHWLYPRRVLSLLLPGLLAIHPGLIINTAWWGQNEALFMLPLVLMLLSLSYNKPLIAWVLFAIALLTKQQSLVMTPLIFIVSYRRFGLRSLVTGGFLAAAVVTVIFLPFIATSGLQTALWPFVTIISSAGSTANSALNLWSLLDRIHASNTIFIPPLTYGQVGLLLLGIFTLIISVGMWQQASLKREFVWATALYLTTFVVQTQMHERYLYPACIFAVFAIAQDRRLWIIALSLLITFTYNVLKYCLPIGWLGLYPTASQSSWQIGLVNLILMVGAIWIAVRVNRTPNPSQVIRWVSLSLRLAATLLILNVFLLETIASFTTFSTAQWLAAHVADHSRLVSEATSKDVRTFTQYWSNTRTWDWQYVNTIESRPVSEWLTNIGAHYLVIGNKASMAFTQRINALTQDEAMLLYTHQDTLKLTPAQAVLWTFRPEHLLNITFDDTLRFIGYNIIEEDGKFRLLMHWYTQQTPEIAYQIFIHVIDPETGKLFDQADTILGGYTHPTNKWRRNELVFELVDLPDGFKMSYQLRLGLYDLTTGVRAKIQDEQQLVINDHFEIHITPNTQP